MVPDIEQLRAFLRKRAKAKPKQAGAPRAANSRSEEPRAARDARARHENNAMEQVNEPQERNWRGAGVCA